MSFPYRGTLLVLWAALTAAAAPLAPASAQTRNAARSIPRTPDGHPDLQGNWTNATLTPFQRAEGQGLVLTPDEVAELEGRAAALVEAGSQPSDPDRAPPRVTGDVGTYNYTWFDRGDQVAIINGEPRSSLLTRPPDGRPPALTPEAEQRLAELRELRGRFVEYDHPELRPLAERCLVSFGSNAGPPMIPNYGYNSNYTIVQTTDHVMIVAEMVHDVRIIRLGDPRPLPKHVHPWFGDSWGRWEGDALVVETTNLNPNHPFRGVPPTDQTKVTERFTLVDEETILYEFTIDDPTTYTQAWGGEIPFNRFDDLVYEYSCHEGNYALSAVLSGARYQERQAAGR